MFTYTVVRCSRMYSNYYSICFELTLALLKFYFNNLVASSKLSSTIVLAPNQRAIFYKFYLDFAFTKTPSLSIKSTFMPISTNIYFYFAPRLRSFVMSSKSMVFSHASIAEIWPTDFILTCIYYVADLILPINFEILIFCILIRHFPLLSHFYNKDCFLNFLLDWLRFLHF